jgi:hypothetical protein
LLDAESVPVFATPRNHRAVCSSQSATLYGKAIATVTKACREGRIVATKPGREYRIDRASAEAYWGNRRNR